MLSRGLLHDAQLLHQTQSVELAPVFNDLPLGYAKLDNPREAGPPAGRSNAEELARVPAGKRYPGHHLVAFGH
jgi:hypothetical protein